VRTLVAIPTRYEPERVLSLVYAVLAEPRTSVLLLDNGHSPALVERIDLSYVEVRSTPELGIYEMWNEAVRVAEDRAVDVLVLLNDDVRIRTGTIGILADVLRNHPEVGVACPDWPTPLDRGIPDRIALRRVGGAGAHEGMTGFCFAMRVGLPVRFDTRFGWWYGDDMFARLVLAAGYRIVRVEGLPIEHDSDAERNGWARRPELEAIAAKDGILWNQLTDENR
jgi:GT2 family glycosyltransferase